jgi:ADP-ribose pyrophosphatase
VASFACAASRRYAGRMVREIYRGRIVNLRVERVTLPNGTAVDLELMHHPGAAAVAAVDAQHRVVLIRQYRHAAGGFVWELPAGVLDPGEAPAACAARELVEEAGLTAEDLLPLSAIFTTPGFCDERIHLFLARGLAEVPTAHEADEVIAEIARVPLAEALAMTRDGTIVDGKTVAGLYLAAGALGLLA